MSFRVSWFNWNNALNFILSIQIYNIVYDRALVYIIPIPHSPPLCPFSLQLTRLLLLHFLFYVLGFSFYDHLSCLSSGHLSWLKCFKPCIQCLLLLSSNSSHLVIQRTERCWRWVQWCRAESIAICLPMGLWFINKHPWVQLGNSYRIHELLAHTQWFHQEIIVAYS